MVRLTAAYEAIVHDTLSVHPSRIDERSSGIELTDALSGWLQESVRRASPPRLGSSDRQRVKEIKTQAEAVRRVLRYRNQIAHRKPPLKEEFSFSQARAGLNRLLALIP